VTGEAIKGTAQGTTRVRVLLPYPFPGPFAPHRLFGEVAHADYVRLQLIHASHHLGHLIPKEM